MWVNRIKILSGGKLAYSPKATPSEQMVKTFVAEGISVLEIAFNPKTMYPKKHDCYSAAYTLNNSLSTIDVTRKIRIILLFLSKY
jgi:hypothetical protein